MIERSLVLIKPDGVKRSLTGEIINRFEKAGLKIAGMKMIWVNPELSKQHYSEHVNKEFYKFLETFITEGPVVAIVFEGVDAVENVRRLTGETEPKTSPPGTIRGDYAHISSEYANKTKRAVQNIIHASGTKEEAKKEVALWFSPEQLFEYQTAHEKYVF